jgi:hypothetical protein
MFDGVNVRRESVGFSDMFELESLTFCEVLNDGEPL